MRGACEPRGAGVFMLPSAVLLGSVARARRRPGTAPAGLAGLLVRPAGRRPGSWTVTRIARVSVHAHPRAPRKAAAADHGTTRVISNEPQQHERGIGVRLLRSEYAGEASCVAGVTCRSGVPRQAGWRQPGCGAVTGAVAARRVGLNRSPGSVPRRSGGPRWSRTRRTGAWTRSRWPRPGRSSRSRRSRRPAPWSRRTARR